MQRFFLSAKCSRAHSQCYVDTGHDTSDMLQNFGALTLSWWLKTKSLFEGRACWWWVKSPTHLAWKCSTLAREVNFWDYGCGDSGWCLLSCHWLDSFTIMAKVVTTNLIASKLRIFVSNCHCSFKPQKWHTMGSQTDLTKPSNSHKLFTWNHIIKQLIWDQKVGWAHHRVPLRALYQHNLIWRCHRLETLRVTCKNLYFVKLDLFLPWDSTLSTVVSDVCCESNYPEQMETPVRLRSL